MSKYFKIYFDLIKYKVSIAVTFTAITGYLIYTGSFNADLCLLAIGVFVLAGGSSALNEWQESDYDARMERTSMRPIPTGAISPQRALMAAVLSCLLGLALLYLAFGWVTTLLGFSNIIWYNGIYTTLKRVSPFAVVPGSMVGAIPVLMGWTAAGGYAFDKTIIFVAFFMFIWQIPHFWLLMLKYGKQYEAAGFKTIHQVVNTQNLKWVIFSWVVATSFSSIIVPLFLVHVSLAFFSIIFALNLVFIAVFVKLAFANEVEINFRKSFISINLYMMLFMVILIAYHLIF